MKEYKKLIDLPANCRALIVTDIHGNLKDYNRYLELWDDFKGKDNHFILTGDFIHSTSAKDGSLDIIESVKWHYEHEENFHALLGNHEWAQLTNTSVYKMGYNQNYEFLNLVEAEYGDHADEKLREYNELFKNLAIAVRTENKVLVSHAGPARSLESEDDIKYLSNEDYSVSRPLYEILWDRNENLSLNYLDPFLHKFNCRTSIVGHTPVNGVELHGNQLVVSSSFGMGEKAYVELDLEAEIRGGRDLIDMVVKADF